MRAASRTVRAAALLATLLGAASAQHGADEAVRAVESALAAGDASRAEAALAALSASDPRTALLRAEIALVRGDGAGAEAAARAAEVAAGADAILVRLARRTRARALDRAGRDAEAAQAWLAVAAPDDAGLEALDAAAAAFRRAADFSRAQAAFALAGRIAPAPARAAGEAEAALEAGAVEAASATLTAALRRFPRDHALLLLRARALHAAGDAAAARAALEALDRVASPGASATRALAWLEVEAGAPEAAERRFRTGALRGPLGADVVEALIDAYGAAGRDADVLRLAAEVADGEGGGAGAATRPSTWRRIARAAARSGAVDLARRLATRVAATAEPEGEVALAHADLLDAAGARDEARGALERALARKPLDGAVRAALAERRFADGDRAGGLALLADGLRLAPGDVALRAAADAAAEAGGDEAGPGEAAFVLRADGLEKEGAIFPLGDRSTFVRLRALRVSARSSKASVRLGDDDLTARALARALDALAAAGFTRVRVR